MNPINIYAYIHDSVKQSTVNTLKKEYFDNFTPELTALSGRSVNVQFTRQVPGITDFDYLSMADGNLGDILNAWYRVIFQHTTEQNLLLTTTDRYALIIEGYLIGSTGGGAFSPEFGGNVLIASTLTTDVVAHEIGHTFGATHENAEYEPDPNNPGEECSTFLATGNSENACSLKRYSAANSKIMVEYLSQQP